MCTDMTKMGAAVRAERLIALLVCCVENILHGGLIFGWPSLVFVLKDLGYYGYLCSSGSENATAPSPTSHASVSPQVFTENVSASTPLFSSTCDEQDAALQLVFTVTVAIQACCMFPVGLFFDRFGSRISRLIMAVLMLFGYVMMGFTSRTRPHLLFPATISFTIASVMLILSSLQTGNLFGSLKSTVLTVINSMYSATVLVFLIAKVAYNAGFSINVFFLILAGSSSLLIMDSVLFYPIKYIPWPLPDNYRLPCSQTARCFSSQYEDSSEKDVDVYDNKGYVAEGDNRMTQHYRQNGESGESANTATGDIGRQTGGKPSVSVYEISLEDRKRREYPSLKSCILSSRFFLLLVWQVFLELDMLFTFGSLNSFLTRLANGDEDTVSWYTNVFSITQFFVVLVGPLGGLLMDRDKLSCRQNGTSLNRAVYADMQDSCLPLAITSLSSMLYSCCMLLPSLPAQYLSFVFILILRSLQYGVGPAVVTIVFPMQYFASVYGAIRTISGMCSLLQYPIFIAVQQYLDDDPFYIFVAFIIADIITLVLPVALYVQARRMSARTSKNPITTVGTTGKTDPVGPS